MIRPITHTSLSSSSSDSICSMSSYRSSKLAASEMKEALQDAIHALVPEAANDILKKIYDRVPTLRHHAGASESGQGEIYDSTAFDLLMGRIKALEHERDTLAFHNVRLRHKVADLQADLADERRGSPEVGTHSNLRHPSDTASIIPKNELPTPVATLSQSRNELKNNIDMFEKGLNGRSLIDNMAKLGKLIQETEDDISEYKARSETSSLVSRSDLVASISELENLTQFDQYLKRASMQNLNESVDSIFHEDAHQDQDLLNLDKCIAHVDIKLTNAKLGKNENESLLNMWSSA